MFSLLILALLQDAAAADLSQPPQLRGQGIITHQDYPTEALRRSEYGIVSVLLRVSAEGRVTSCEVTETSGSTTLDMSTCSLLERRARFHPARDAAGAAVAGEYRLANSWGVDQHQPTTAIDLPLQVSRIPPGYRSPVKARLVFGAAGRVAACEVTATSGSEAADRAACAYIRQALVIPAPRSGAKDIPPAAVRYLSASLETRPDAP